MHAVITGASSGLGEYLAVELGRRGYSVGLIARRADLLDAVAEKVRAAGGKAACAVADVTDRPGLDAAIASLVAQHGPVDLMVANAGGGIPMKATKLDPDKFNGVLRLNVEGVVNAFAAVLPSMLERKSGHLAATASLAGKLPLPGHGGYSASKSAVAMICATFASELAPHGIAVSCINPGFVKTPMTAKNKFPMPFLMEPEAAARLMANGLERRRRVIEFPWPLALLARIGTWLPQFVVDAIVTRNAPS